MTSELERLASDVTGLDDAYSQRDAQGWESDADHLTFLRALLEAKSKLAEARADREPDISIEALRGHIGLMALEVSAPTPASSTAHWSPARRSASARREVASDPPFANGVYWIYNHYIDLSVPQPYLTAEVMFQSPFPRLKVVYSNLPGTDLRTQWEFIHISGNRYHIKSMGFTQQNRFLYQDGHPSLYCDAAQNNPGAVWRVDYSADELGYNISHPEQHRRMVYSRYINSARSYYPLFGRPHEMWAGDIGIQQVSS